MTSVTPPGQSPVQHSYNDAGQGSVLTYPDGQQVFSVALRFLILVDLAGDRHYTSRLDSYYSLFAR